MPKQNIQIETPDGVAEAILATPAGATPNAGVILYMDAVGWRDELDRLCLMFAEAGYRTFLPDLFWRQGTLRFSAPPSADGPFDPAMAAANLATTMVMTAATRRFSESAAAQSEAKWSHPTIPARIRRSRTWTRPT